MSSNQVVRHESEESVEETQSEEQSKPARKPSRAAQRRARRRGKAATAFRPISEVADELDVQQHVLRFWESKFPQVKPMKRGGGRRYYRPEDVDLLKQIHTLLYSEGYTIKGVQKLLQSTKASDDLVIEGSNDRELIRKQAVSNVAKKYRSELKNLLGDLREIRSMIEA